MARYFGRKVTIDSIKFDSEMEGRYYEELKRRTENDEITLMKDHPKYVLLDNFKYNGENIRGFSYEADFIYVDKENLTIHIEDVKGHVASNDAFTLQWKLFRKEVLKLFTENPLDMVKYLDKDIYEFFKDKEDKIKLPIFRIIKWSKTTGFVDYKDYKKAMASARSKAIAEKNEAVKAKELMKKELMQIKKLREKPTALTKLQAKKLAELEEKYKEYII